MPTVSQFIGLKEANRALKQLPDFAKPGVQKVMDTTAYRVSEGAKSRVRRRTGLLASRIKWQTRPRSLSAVVGVAPEVYYWKFLEYGTVKMEAHPFFRPAAQGEESRHKDEIVKALEAAGDRVEQAQASAMGGRFL